MKDHRAWYEYKIDSMDDLLKIIDKSTNMPSFLEHPSLYRGQANSDWMITSTFYRTFAKRFHVPTIETFEDLQMFQETDYSSYIKCHDNMLRSFIRNVSAINSTFQYKTPDIYLALAQHYGMPTNLIDFTTSIEIALFFCFEKDEPSEYAALYRTNSSLFLEGLYQIINNGPHFIDDATLTKIKTSFRTFEFSSINPHIPIATYDSIAINTRIKMQQGTFFYLPKGEPYDIIMYRLKERMNGHYEKRYLINRKLKSDILEYLKNKGITKDTIYPPQTDDPFVSLFQECSKKALSETICMVNAGMFEV